MKFWWLKASNSARDSLPRNQMPALKNCLSKAFQALDYNPKMQS